jgi:hypothetical protein
MLLSQFRELIVNLPVSNQASTSKRYTWRSYIADNGAAGGAFRSIFGAEDQVKLSRNDLRDRATKPDLTEFVMATIIWGYTGGMRGNNVRNLIQHLGTLTQLLGEARANPLADWSIHYEEVQRMKGIGLSTYTKFLNFLPAKVHDYEALILDDTIIRIASQGIFEELAPLRDLKRSKAADSYPSYLKCMHSVATDLGVRAEVIEYFLFVFGLNLKSSAANDPPRGRRVLNSCFPP